MYKHHSPSNWMKIISKDRLQIRFLTLFTSTSVNKMNKTTNEIHRWAKWTTILQTTTRWSLCVMCERISNHDEKIASQNVSRFFSSTFSNPRIYFHIIPVIAKMIRRLVLLIVVINVVRGNYTEINLSPNHMKYYFNNFPTVAEKCRNDARCPYKVRVHHSHGISSFLHIFKNEKNLNF